MSGLRRFFSWYFRTWFDLPSRRPYPEAGPVPAAEKLRQAAELMRGESGPGVDVATFRAVADWLEAVAQYDSVLPAVMRFHAGAVARAYLGGDA